jgi:SynChlorMet cassette radical SAM/SPASM protein ScmF
MTNARAYPLHQIYFYLTEGCNLACRHCWLAPKFDPDARRYSVLAKELFETAIREAKPLGLTGVKLTGGEPLMHPQIVTLLEIVRREELRLTVETNGIACSPDLAIEIARSPTAFVSVSLDGADAATHEWVRGVRGSFERALQGVRNLVGVGIRPQIIMSVMERNASQVDAIIRLAEEIGASSVKFNIVQPTGRGEMIHDGSQGLAVAQLIELGHHVEVDLAKRTKLSLHFDYPLAFRPLSRIGGENGCGTCGILGILGVVPDGYYALCGIGEQVPELVFGRVGEDRLAHVWLESAVLNELRAGLPDHLGGVCATCIMTARCLGACVAQNYYRTGHLLAPFWFCEVASRANLFPASRQLATHSASVGSPEGSEVRNV